MLSELFTSSDSTTWILIGILIAVFMGTLVYLGARVPLMWTIAKFGYANALYNSRINKFVKKIYVNNLIGSNNLSEAINLVNSVNTRDFPLKSAKTVGECEKIINRSINDKFEEAIKECPRIIHGILDAFLVKYENRTLKIIFRTHIQKGKIPENDKPHAIGRLNEKLVDEMLKAETLAELIDLVPRDDVRKLLKENPAKNFQQVDRLLDMSYVDTLKTRSSELPGAVKREMEEFIGVYVDKLNIMNAMRMVKWNVPVEERKNIYYFAQGKNINGALLEAMVQAQSVSEEIEVLKDSSYGPIFRELYPRYKETGRLSVFDKELERFWLRYIDNFGSKMNTTVGPIFRYLLELEFEMRNVISVLRGYTIPGGVEMARELIVLREGEI